MSTSSELVCVPGPMHPDMFDGETPILVPLAKPPKVYEVAVSYTVTERETRRIRVAANNKREAMAAAVAQAEEQADDNEDDFEAEHIQALDCAPNDSELTAWQARRGGVKGMTTYSDEYLEHHADRFVALRLDLHGLSLEQYLAAPERYEHLAHEPFPLLPAQRAVAERVYAQELAEEAERQTADLPRRNGAVVEPLHHHRHPKRGPSANFTRRAKA